MSPKSFTTSKLSQFVLLFPSTRVRYEYDTLSDVHFIEIIPNEVYHSDKGYINWEVSFYDEFVSLFPDESISFITDDALISLKNPSDTFYGHEFECSTFLNL